MSIFYCQNSYAVVPVDSLIKIFHQQLSYDLKEAHKNAMEAFRLSKKLKDKKNIAYSLGNIGLFYFVKGDLNKSLTCYEIALKIYRLIHDTSGIAQMHHQIGTVYYNQSNYTVAIEYYIQSLNLMEATHDDLGIANNLHGMGMVHYRQGLYDSSVEFFSKALSIYRQLKNKEEIAQTLVWLGNNYQAKKDFKKAIAIFSGMLAEAKAAGDKESEAICLSNLGSVNFDEKNFYAAIENFRLALEVYDELDTKDGTATGSCNLGAALIETDSIEEGMKYLRQSMAMAKEIGRKDLLVDIYESFSDAYKKQNDFNTALHYFELSAQLKDSILNETVYNQIAELQAKYETTKKNNEIIILKNEKELQTTKIKRQQTLLFLISVTAFLIIIIALMLFLYYRLRQREEHGRELLKLKKNGLMAVIEAQETERKRIAQDLHDSAGVLLAALKMKMSNLSHADEKQTEDRKKEYRQSIEILDKAYTEIRTVSHQMIPKTLSDDGLTYAIEELLSVTLKNSNVQYEFIHHNINDIPENISITVYRICQELLSNVLKHSGAGRVSVNLFKSEDTLILITEDNGTGIQAGSGKNGIGLLNIASRTEAVNGVFSISPGMDIGTITTIRIPLPKS